MMSEHMKWQPIETAPKDGTAIIACSHGEKISVPVCWITYTEEGGCWDIEGGLTLKGYSPSLWMPMPKAPGADMVLNGLTKEEDREGMMSEFDLKAEVKKVLTQED